MDKVFITLDGKYYRAKEPKTEHCAEMNFPTEDHLTHLTEVPITELQFGILVHKARIYG